MSDVLISEPDGPTIPVRLIPESGWAEALETQGGARLKALARTQEFTGRAGQVMIAPGADGAPEAAYLGMGKGALRPMALRTLAGRLPPGDYVLQDAPGELDPVQAGVAFALGAYRFDRYRKRGGPGRARLVLPSSACAAAQIEAQACALARDMINTPANDMGPLQIETIAREIAEAFGAQITVIAGEGLLEANFPAVHAVGRAATPQRAPRMIEITWGDQTAPRLALVGKGVVFDTGGLDIKPSSGMRLMKKDMGGAASVLALGRMIMAAALPVRLTILTPVVENAISGDAMRPGDILASRKGMTIEVGNTDAEGRLILADALTRAAELEPELTIDMATLTGAARAALGPQLPPFFTDDDALARAIEEAAEAVDDPVWRMPLWSGYSDALDSDIADIKNDPDAWAQAGAVTAALFLQKFAPTTGSWVHLDVMAWNPRNRPGWPSGGEAQGVRALYRMIRARYG